MAEDKKNKSESKNNAALHKLAQEQKKSMTIQTGSIGRIEGLLTKISKNTETKKGGILGGTQKVNVKKDTYKTDDFDPRKSLKVLKNIESLLGKGTKKKESGVLGILMAGAGVLLSGATMLFGLVSKGGMLLRAGSLLFNGGRALFHLVTKGGLLYRASAAMMASFGKGGIATKAFTSMATMGKTAIAAVVGMGTTAFAVIGTTLTTSLGALVTGGIAGMATLATGALTAFLGGLAIGDMIAEALGFSDDGTSVGDIASGLGSFFTGNGFMKGLEDNQIERLDTLRAEEKGYIDNSKNIQLQGLRRTQIGNPEDGADHGKVIPGQSSSVMSKPDVNLNNLDFGPSHNSIDKHILASYGEHLGKSYAPVITSARRTAQGNAALEESVKKSKHLTGNALDLRVNDIDKKTSNKITRSLAKALGEDFDVLQHGKGANRHIHMEYDPKPKKYAGGGVVPGNAMIGDRVPALVNSGEMILNKEQQTNLFNMANASGLSQNIPHINVAGMDSKSNSIKEMMSFLEGKFSSVLAKAIAEATESQVKKRPKSSNRSMPDVDIT